MPTLPLYTPNPGHPDASHAVIAPGGYERWYFDAESESGDLRVVAVFSQGTADHPDHSTYLRRLHHYRLAPTRRPPPVPAESSAVSVAVYKDAAVVASAVSPCAPGQFRASQDRLDIAAGVDCVATGSDGSFRLRVAGPDVDLTFRPVWAHRPREVVLFPGHQSPAHHWIVAAPGCSVEGTVCPVGGTAVRFTGSGYHDHHFGTQPVGPWMRGRVLGEGGVTAFHIRGGGTPTDGPVTYRGEAHCVRVDADGMSGSPVALELEWARSLTSIRFEETGLTLSRPRVLDTSGGVKRMVYDVSAQTSSALDGRVALCERS